MPPKKLNSFNFKCSNCGCKYNDSSYDQSLESECSDCGTYNYKETAKLKALNKTKMNEEKTKIIMDTL